jgi:inosose dehydratase
MPTAQSSVNPPSSRRRLLQFLALAALGPCGALAAGRRMPFRFGVSAASYGTNIEKAIQVAAHVGLPGLEPFRDNVINYLERPLELKKIFDAAGVTMITCSNGGPHFSNDLTDPAKVAQTIKDHVAFARDFILPFGYCDHFKANPHGTVTGRPTDDQLKIAADAMNEIGRQTLEFGIKFSPHPHVGSLVETEHEVRTLMALTDPRYVFLVTDTAHLTLGGMDPLQIMKDYWQRIAEIHYKDTAANLRNNKTLAVPVSGPQAGGHGWFRNLGGRDSGGVNFSAIQKFLLEKNYRGWITLDLDASMIEGKDMEETMRINIKYLIDVLGVDPKAV